MPENLKSSCFKSSSVSQEVCCTHMHEDMSVGYTSLLSSIFSQMIPRRCRKRKPACSWTGWSLRSACGTRPCRPCWDRRNWRAPLSAALAGMPGSCPGTRAGHGLWTCLLAGSIRPRDGPVRTWLCCSGRQSHQSDRQGVSQPVGFGLAAGTIGLSWPRARWPSRPREERCLRSGLWSGWWNLCSTWSWDLGEIDWKKAAIKCKFHFCEACRYAKIRTVTSSGEIGRKWRNPCLVLIFDNPIPVLCHRTWTL